MSKYAVVNIHHQRWIESLKEGVQVLVDDGTTRYRANFLMPSGLNESMVDAEYAKVETVENWMLFPVLKKTGRGKYPNK